MAIIELSNDQQTAASTALANGRMHGPPAALSEAQHATVEMLRYWNLLWARKWLIMAVTIAMALGVGSYTRFCKVKLYRAEALVTPTAPGDGGDELGLSPMGGVAGAGGLGMLLGFSGPGDNVVIAERYMAIMRSYAFGTALAARYGLARRLAGARAASLTPWRIHMLLNERFDFEYDYRSGNLTLYFIDPDPARAQMILGLYLQNLRDKLRNEAVQTAAAAAASLQEEVRRTPDELLQNQLYELMARQIERGKLAQVQANFAFKVIEPPVVPDHYYAPSARRAGLLSGVLTLCGVCLLLVIREWIAAARLHLEARASSFGAGPHDTGGRSRGAADRAKPGVSTASADELAPPRRVSEE